MPCISPITVDLNGVGKTTVSCGKCWECLRQKRNEWSFRLYQEQKVCDSAVFVTLTYSDENLPVVDDYYSLNKKHYQNFIKAVRYENKKYSDAQVRYYGVGEYGTKTKRPHYHLILFNCTVETLEKLPEIWDKGHTHIGSATPSAIRYITKYLINKKKKQDDGFPKVAEFSTMSRRPAIGSNYLKSHFDYHRRNDQVTVRNDVGVEQPLPRYYKEKMFSKKELKLINEINQEKYDKRELERQTHIEKSGQNYFKLKQEKRELEVENALKKLNKKNTI